MARPRYTDLWNPPEFYDDHDEGDPEPEPPEYEAPNDPPSNEPETVAPRKPL